MNERIKELRDVCSELHTAAKKFWKLQDKVTGSGAVKWVTFADGSVLIFTRAEYKDQLMNNIPSLGKTTNFANYEEIEDE